MTGHHRNPPQRILDRYQCTKEDWLLLRDIGLKMIDQGSCNKDTTPLRAYQHQAFRAGKRDIEFKLTLMEWWRIWQESGRWAERGHGRGWQMCRKGDQGAYEVGNVFIGYGAENLSAAAKSTDLPIGVARAHKGNKKRYRAYCNVFGRQRHIGLFATPEEAEQAYLKAVALDKELKAHADKMFERLKCDVQGAALSVVRFNAENGAKSKANNPRAAA